MNDLELKEREQLVSNAYHLGFCAGIGVASAVWFLAVLAVIWMLADH